MHPPGLLLPSPGTCKHQQLLFKSSVVAPLHRLSGFTICSRRAHVTVDGEFPSATYTAGSTRCPHQLPVTSRPRTEVLASSPVFEGQITNPSPLPARSEGSKVGVVIVDHGSRKKASNDMLVDFGNLYGRVTGQEIVEIAHMEIAEPTIADAIGRCAAQGARTVVIAPYFLSRGRHIQEDIPALVRQAKDLHPGLHCIIADPIGLDVLMVELINNRVAAALSKEYSSVETEPGKLGTARRCKTSNGWTDIPKPL